MNIRGSDEKIEPGQFREYLPLGAEAPIVVRVVAVHRETARAVFGNTNKQGRIISFSMGAILLERLGKLLSQEEARERGWVEQ